MVKETVKGHAKQIRGVSYKPNDLHGALDDKSVILLRANNIDDGKINFEDVVYVDKSKVSNEQYLRRGDVLICASSGSKQLVGKAASVDFDTPCTFGAFCKVVRPNTGWADYLGIYFQSNVYRREISALAIGANINNIRNEHVDCLTLNIWSEDKQKRIVNQMSKLKVIIDKRKDELAKMDELIKARFVELFGDPIQNPYDWEKKRFDEICENLDSRRKPITSSDRVEGIYPYYGASGIVDYVEDYIFDEDILLVSEDGANLLMRSTPIAFSVSGKVWVNNHAHVVRFDKMCLQKYIEIFFSLIDISDSITGSAQPKLNQAKLNAMEFPIPNESLLEDYLRFLKQVDKSKSVIQQSLEKTHLLFDSLMQEYFG